MNETFIRKNDIGVDIEYTIIARYKSEQRDYIIYTDFVSDDKFGLRLFVDMVSGDKYITLSDSGKEQILNTFKEELKNIIDTSLM